MDAAELRRQLAAADQLVQEQDEWIQTLEVDNSRFAADLTDSNAALEEATSNLDKTGYAIQALKDQLDRAGQGRSSLLDVETLLSLVRRSDAPTPAECLDLLEECSRRKMYGIEKRT